MAKIIFSGSPKDTEYFLGRGRDSATTIIEQYGSLKPCITGSDAHSLSDIDKQSPTRLTWIKADATFEGLKQILHEPAERVFKGPIPISIAKHRDNASHIIDRLHIRRKTTALSKDIWFKNLTIPLNPGLVAIIGNKGSGKSALADILGLLGNTKQNSHFSFLSPKKFYKDKLANDFEACLYWSDKNSTNWIPLHNSPTAPLEYVKYLPQQYLENICSEIGNSNSPVDSLFYKELQKVIFSHIPPEERLDSPSLSDLLTQRSKEMNDTISLLKGELWEINKEIVTLEEQMTPEYSKTLDALLESKTKELHALTAPTPIQPPQDNAENATTQTKLANKRKELEAVEERIAQVSDDIKKINDKIAALARIEGKLTYLNQIFESTKKTIQEESVDLDWENLLKLQINSELIQTAQQEATKNKASLLLLIQQTPPGKHILEKQKICEEILQLESQLGTAAKKYHDYLTEDKRIKEARNKISGTPEIPGTIEFLKNTKTNLKENPYKYKILQKKRFRKVLEIYKKKCDLADQFREYHRSIAQYLKNHPVALKNNFKMSFNVSIVSSDFSEIFLAYINQRKRGAFYGLDDGKRALESLIQETNFDSPYSTLRFIRKLFKRLHETQNHTIAEQLLRPDTIKEFYQAIFSLGYLEPKYSLEWDGKNLNTLSPGERGALLLIFFLLVDLDPNPLIIDQPEDNLDNQTIYTLLVPCINDAKQRRQIILVTHNPNLAVVCDAEQIICADINKNVGNAVSYTTGSIENETINKKILDILEGTRPAFNIRDLKYRLTKKLRTSQH